MASPRQAKQDATAPEDSALAEVPADVLQLLTVTQDLTAVMRRETALLEEKRTKEAGAIHGEKLRLATEYRKAIGRLKVQKHLLGPPGSEIRKQIDRINENFRTELKRNAKTVVRLKTVTEGIIKSISDEAAKKNAPVSQYGRNAVVGGFTGKPASISINAVI